MCASATEHMKTYLSQCLNLNATVRPCVQLEVERPRCCLTDKSQTVYKQQLLILLSKMLTCVSQHPSAAPHGKCGHMPGPPEQDSYKVIKKNQKISLIFLTSGNPVFFLCRTKPTPLGLPA